MLHIWQYLIRFNFNAQYANSGHGDKLNCKKLFWKYFGWSSNKRDKEITQNEVSLNFLGYTKNIKMCNIHTIEKSYKMVTKNDRNILKFLTFVRFLGPFLRKQRFEKMGVAGFKWGSCPPILYYIFEIRTIQGLKWV